MDYANTIFGQVSKSRQEFSQQFFASCPTLQVFRHDPYTVGVQRDCSAAPIA
ncbi:hypothetical protein [uncultured Nostoc sp.]|uniref:hypothetical protein n=1 Tax=uncultured Nostoc sp. TaxID=340711 RepID=UPI0035C9C408